MRTAISCWFKAQPLFRPIEMYIDEPATLVAVDTHTLCVCVCELMMMMMPCFFFSELFYCCCRGSNLFSFFDICFWLLMVHSFNHRCCVTLHTEPLYKSIGWTKKKRKYYRHPGAFICVPRYKAPPPPFPSEEIQSSQSCNDEIY